MKKLQFDDYKLGLLQQNVEQAIDDAKTIFAGGRLIAQVALTVSGAAIDHKLGKIPVGFLVISKNADTNVWLTNKDDKTISLSVSATVTVDLWVF